MGGMLGCGGGPSNFFFPSRCFEAAGSEERVGDHGHQGVHLDARIGWQVRHVVFLLAIRPAFADEPDFVARHAPHTIIEHAVPWPSTTRTRRAAK